MKLDGNEMSILLVSLIQRRNNILGLLDIDCLSDSNRDSYSEEMKVVETLIERIFPGSVERIKATENSK